MLRYATHLFASRETLLQAVRWLRLLGIEPGDIEINDDGLHRISVLALSSQTACTAARVFEAAERTDPKGWPSFWDLSRKTFEHHAPPNSLLAADHHAARTTPIGWHPPDRLLH